ncbi:hypothetical protein Pden_3859 [Paracoccus denitrificans PD1222]|uniref:Uncharacterized protein n=1 Tax=Paracoccus denitrificans (strain Pd 1222) TaxID=318586 RepID=A1B8T1_PARDP|nr:hypothetical protein Pden_3859 [Paracoccus denitrificans PD1222]
MDRAACPGINLARLALQATEPGSTCKCRRQASGRHGTSQAPVFANVRMDRFVPGIGARTARHRIFQMKSIGNGGEGGIRTHGTREGSTVFETAPFDHSGTSPRFSGGGGDVDGRGLKRKGLRAKTAKNFSYG